MHQETKAPDKEKASNNQYQSTSQCQPKQADNHLPSKDPDQFRNKQQARAIGSSSKINHNQMSQRQIEKMASIPADEHIQKDQELLEQHSQGRWSDVMANSKADQLLQYQDSDPGRNQSSDRNSKPVTEQQPFGRRYEEDFRSSNANKSDTAHFNDPSVVQNQDLTEHVSPYTSEEKMEDQKQSIRYQGNHLPASKQKANRSNESMALNKPSSQMIDHDEEEMIDEIIETDPDEEQPHPVDDPIDSNNDDLVTNFQMKGVESQNIQINDNEYGFYNEEHDEEAINQSVDRINPQQFQRGSQHLNSSKEQYMQIGSHLTSSQHRTYHSYKSSISSPSVNQLEGGSRQDNDSIHIENDSQMRNIQFGNNFRMKAPLSAAKKRPSDTQSRGERRLLSANSLKNGQKREQQRHYNNMVSQGNMYNQYAHHQQVQQQQQMQHNQQAIMPPSHPHQQVQHPRSNQQIYIQNQQMIGMRPNMHHPTGHRFPYAGSPQHHSMSAPMRGPPVYYRQGPQYPGATGQNYTVMVDPRQRMYQQVPNMINENGQIQQFGHQTFSHPVNNSYQMNTMNNHPMANVGYAHPQQQPQVSSPLSIQSNGQLCQQQNQQSMSQSMQLPPPPQSFQLDMEFSQRRAHPFQMQLYPTESDLVRERAPKSINDTIELFTKFLLQQSHIKPIAVRQDQLKEQACKQTPSKELLILASMNQSTSRTPDAISQFIDTDSRTEDADFSQYIDKQSPIKVDEFDKHDQANANDTSPTTLKMHGASKQIHVQQVDAQNKKKLMKVRDEEALTVLKKDAIHQKKELRQKRLVYKKQEAQKHVQMDEDQEFFPTDIITYENSGQRKQEPPQSSDETQQQQAMSDGNQGNNQSFPNFFQQRQSQQQQPQPLQQPNQDLINLENNNLQMQEQERRNQKRQQQQLQEQQFRLSMSSMKGIQISEVIPEDHNESQRSRTSRESPKEPIDESMIQQDNNFDEEVVGEIQQLDNVAVAELGEQQKRRKSQAHQSAANDSNTTQQEKKQQDKQAHQAQSQQPLVTPRSQQQIQCLEVDESEFQKLIDNDVENIKPFDSEPKKKKSLNKDLEEIESKKNAEAEEIQDQIQELLDQKTDEVKQQINKVEKKQLQKMSYELIFQDSLKSNNESQVEQVEVESPGIKTEQVIPSVEQSRDEIEDEKQNQQSEIVMQFQQQLDQMHKIVSNLNEFVEKGDYQEDKTIKSQQEQMDREYQAQKHIEIEQKENLESQAQQSQLFDKSTVHTLKEDKHMRLEGRSQTQSDNGMNEGIINIKTSKINFKKSQSMRKIKVSKNIKIKRTKLKRASKVQGNKTIKVNQFGGRRFTTNTVRNQPVKKSHSLDSMQVFPNHSIVADGLSPTYGSTEFTNNPQAYYAIQRNNYDMRQQQYQQQLQFMGNAQRTKWRSNSPKKDLKLVRRSSYSPVNNPTPIYYELHQQLKNSGAHPRDFRSERKKLKSAHPYLVNLKGGHHGMQRYPGMGNQTTKNSQPNLKKIKLKKLQSALGPNQKQQKLNDTRIMIRGIQSPQGNMIYNNRQEHMMNYQRMGPQPQIMNNYVSPVNMPMITRHQLMRSATSRIDSANSQYFATGSNVSSNMAAQHGATMPAGLHKGQIKPIQVYKMPPYMMTPQEAQSRSQMLPTAAQQHMAAMGGPQRPLRMAAAPTGVVLPRPPRQHHDIKNSTLGASSGLMQQAAKSQNAMMDQHMMQRHRSAKSALRPNAMHNPLMASAGGAPLMPPQHPMTKPQALQRYKNQVDGVSRREILAQQPQDVFEQQKRSMFATHNTQSVGQLMAQVGQQQSPGLPIGHVKQSPYNQRLRLPKSGSQLKKQSNGSVLQNRFYERQINVAGTQRLQNLNSMQIPQGRQYSSQQRSQVKGSLPILHMDGLV